MKTEYKGKKVLITGFAKRVGADIARELSDYGIDLTGHYNKSKVPAEVLKAEIEAGSMTQVELATGDLSKRADIQALVEGIYADVLVCNAGTFAVTDPKIADPLEAEEVAFDENIGANMKGPILLARAFAERLKREGRKGTIFIIGDYFNEAGAYPGNLLSYSASKAFVRRVVAILAAQYGRFGIRVIGIMNGPIEPPPGAPPEVTAAIASGINLPQDELHPWLGGRRVGEVVFAAAFIMTGINGVCIDLTGGWIWMGRDEHSA